MQCIPKLKWVVIAATSVVVVYVIGVLLNAPLQWVYALYGSSLAACLWMTLRILKDPYTSDKSFDDYFYQDRPDIRRIGKE
jgi:hypothetical protein